MNLTYAEQRALEIGITIAGGAEVILLDEPTAGMSKSETDALRRTDPRGHRRQDAADGGARHGRGVRPGRQDRRAGLRRGDRLRHARCRARRRARAGGVPRFGAGRGSSRRRGREHAASSPDLHAYYGKSHILHGVDLDVGEGEIVSLLGRNGSGRSTTVKTIMGLVDGGARSACATRDPRPQGLRDRPSRHRLRAREPRHLSEAHGAPEPAARREARQQPGRAGASTTCTALPAPEGARSTPRPACSPAASSRCSRCAAR